MGNFFADAAEWLQESFFDKDNLEFDTDNLRQQADKIKSVTDDFRAQEKKLTSSIQGLRDTWKTGASKEFFKKYDVKWSSQLASYFDMLDALYNDLIYAVQEYESIRIHS